MIEITDLNTDCLYLIFNHLDVNDLTNMAQVNFEFESIASDVYRRNYVDYKIQIDETENEDLQKPYHIDQIQQFIKIQDFKVASNVMKYFGNHIRNLSIRNNPSRNYTSGSDWTMINQFINKYASKSVVHLKLNIIGNELWPLIEIPFTNVKKLDIEVAQLNEKNDGMKLNEMCPNLKALHIRLIGEINYDFINCELPHLQHLDIKFYNWYENRKEQIIGLIRKNAQIRSVAAKYTPPTFVKVVQELLPILENLTLEFSDDKNEALHFKSVKHCVLHTSWFMKIKKLSFSRLESLETTYSMREFEKFTEFFRRHTTLERLTLYSNQFAQLQLDLLTADLVNLVEMIVKDYFEMNINDVNRFIESHSKLMKFQFKPKKITNADWEIFCKKFEENWHTIYIEEKNAFLFERKNML